MPANYPTIEQPLPKTPDAPGDNWSDNGGAHSWDEYTKRAVDVVALRQDAERRAGRKVRETIGRDTPIDGVYEGTYGGEAIVVDPNKYPAINRACEAVMQKMWRGDAGFDKNLALGAVFDYVSKTMKYDAVAVDEIFQAAGGVDHTKISLDSYINRGVGVCRHQALFAGALLERLRALGILSGQASVERNALQHDYDDKYDGHSWVRYTNSRGEVFILDVAQQKAGRLEDFMTARSSGDRTMWDYGRPEDHTRRRAQMAMQAVERQVEWGKYWQQDPAQRPSLAEYDDQGLLKVPDWVKRQ